MTDRLDIPRQLLSNEKPKHTPSTHHDHLPYRNMTEAQADRQEQYRARVMLFGKNLLSDRIIGRWSDGITGKQLCDHLYPEYKRPTMEPPTVSDWLAIPQNVVRFYEEMPDNEDLSMNQVPE